MMLTDHAPTAESLASAFDDNDQLSASDDSPTTLNDRIDALENALNGALRNVSVFTTGEGDDEWEYDVDEVYVAAIKDAAKALSKNALTNSSLSWLSACIEDPFIDTEMANYVAKVLAEATPTRGAKSAPSKEIVRYASRIRIMELVGDRILDSIPTEYQSEAIELVHDPDFELAPHLRDRLDAKADFLIRGTNGQNRGSQDS